MLAPSIAIDALHGVHAFLMPMKKGMYMCTCVAWLKMVYFPMQCMPCHVGKQNLLSLPIMDKAVSLDIRTMSSFLGRSCIMSEYYSCIDKGTSAVSQGFLLYLICS